MASAVDVNISIDGKKLESFISLSVRQEIFSHHICDIYCRIDAFEKFTISSDSFMLAKAQDMIGKKVKVEINQIGRNNSNGKNCTIFKGIVLEVQGSKYHDAFSGSIHFRCASNDVFLDGNHHCRSFESKSLSDIVKEVTSGYSSNLFDRTAISPNYKGSISYVVQYNETNYEFLRRLAQKYGEWLLITGENHFYFGEPPEKNSKLLHGKDLH